MPWNRLDCRINGISSPLGTGGWVELTDFSVGYYGISTCTLTQKNIRHEATALAYPNDLIEISIDGFTTILWKGRVSRYTPGGVAQEGVTMECVRLEDILRRRTHRWNLKPEWHYNQGLMTDTSSPGYNGTVSAESRWTLGEILIDVLEHGWGLNTASRLTSGGGFANMPLVSDIPLHHTHPLSVTNPYASVIIPGPARDYLDQLVWDAAEIKALLSFRTPDVHFRDNDTWSIIESIVQEAGEHGVFIDPTQQFTPRLVVHKFSNSTLVQIQAGVRGAHVETPSIRLKQDDWEFDDQHVVNLVVIQGAGVVVETNPALAATDPLSGKMDQIDAAGKVWRVRNQDVAHFLSGYSKTVVDTRKLVGDEKKEIRPLLYLGGSPYTDDTASWEANGLCFLTKPISGDVRVLTNFETPFQVSVGPSAASNVQYPTPGAFDAYEEHGIVKEMHISEPQFTTTARRMEQDRSRTFTKPPTPGHPHGKIVVASVQRRKLEELGYDQAFLAAIDRDDTPTMLAYAQEIQRRFRDVSVKLTMTLDGIKLEDLWSNSGTEVGLCKRVSLIGLDGNRWSDAQLQVMSVRVNPLRNEMVVECSSTIYNMTKGLNPDIWRRRKAKRKQEKHQNDLEMLQHADQGGDGDQGGGSPDGEPTRGGIRALSHNSPSPRFVRYPGFREHLVLVTKVPTDPLGVYSGTRIDEFYQDESSVDSSSSLGWDTVVKFFYMPEAINPPIGPLLKVGAVVSIFPVQRDSLQTFLSILSGTDVVVEQDEAHVSNTVTASKTFKAIIWDRRSYPIEEHPPDYSSDPGFDDPLLIGCPPAFPPRKRGEFSWIEVTEFIAGDPVLGIIDRDFGQAGVWVPKPGGRFGTAGQCDAALEANRSNAAIDKVRMVVDLTETIDVVCSSSMTVQGDLANEDASSVFDLLGLETSAVSTRKRYWFNLGVPRSDCAPSYFVSIDPDNDTP